MSWCRLARPWADTLWTGCKANARHFAVPLPSTGPAESASQDAAQRDQAGDAARFRRLQEMAGVEGSSGTHAQPAPARKLDVAAIPMLNVASTCASGQTVEEKPLLHWQDALRTVRTAKLHDVLQDNFGRVHTYLRISLTEKCNLRCQYCMPAEGVELTPNGQLLTAAEIGRLARLFTDLGVTKIRLTGGEPTVRPDFLAIAESLSSLPGLQTLAMTTNGIALRRHLGALRSTGMSVLNISLDTLRPERFEQMTRRNGHGKVMGSIRQAIADGFQVKVNVVVMRGVNDDEVVDFVEMTRVLPVNIRFIEYMPFDGNEWSRKRMFTFKETKALVEDRFGSLERCNDAPTEVAKNYQLDGFLGTVSFITSMTDHFCAGCNRIRLMADGNFKVCLFGGNEVSLRDAMREGASDEELSTIISAAIKRKKFAHADMDVLAVTANRAMIKIGG